MTRKAAVLLALMALTALAFFSWRRFSTRAADLHLAPRAVKAVPRFTVAEAPTYLQADPRWAEARIGGSGEPLAAVGCTLCCLSMALAQHGLDVPPLELNRQLAQAVGYTEDGWVKWNALEKVTAQAVRIELPRNPSHQDLDEALQAGCPILVKVQLGAGVLHWVLLVGRDQNDYLMKDPLGDGKSLRPLAALRSDILAVRIVRKR